MISVGLTNKARPQGIVPRIPHIPRIPVRMLSCKDRVVGTNQFARTQRGPERGRSRRREPSSVLRWSVRHDICSLSLFLGVHRWWPTAGQRTNEIGFHQFDDVLFTSAGGHVDRK